MIVVHPEQVRNTHLHGSDSDVDPNFKEAVMWCAKWRMYASAWMVMALAEVL